MALSGPRELDLDALPIMTAERNPVIKRPSGSSYWV